MLFFSTCFCYYRKVFPGPYFPVLGLNTGKYGPDKAPQGASY